MANQEEMLCRARGLRREMTPHERRLWYEYLRTYPVKFRKQYVLDGFILDFYCMKARIAIELDGNQHYDPDALKYDEQRTAFLKRKGILVLRYRNKDLDDNLSYICDQIAVCVKKRMETFSNPG